MSIISANGLRINYSDTGSGIPVVFIPGIAGSKDWFCYQCAGLSDRYRVITYNLRRINEADRPFFSRLSARNYSLQVLADDLAALLSALHVNVAAIAGYSFGGLIALKFALSYPERCLTLMLSSTIPNFSSQSEAELLKYMLPGEVQYESFWRRLWSAFAGPRQVECNDSDPLFGVAQIDQPTLNARLKILRDTDMTPVMNQVEMPTVIIAGAKESTEILSGSQLMYQSMYDSSLEIIENADQYCFYTDHDRYNAIIADHLAHSQR